MLFGDDRHLGGANSIFADGHAKSLRLQDTPSPDHFMWSKRAYWCGDAPISRNGDSGLTVN